MRFTLAWANTVAQNVTLKMAVIVLSLTSITFAMTTAKLSSQKPLILERGCNTRLVEPSSISHTTAEIEVFIREAARQRFNSDASPIPDYLSREEESARTQEQKELATRNMGQTIIVRGVKTNGSSLEIDADRVISVGQIRSAFVYPFTATLGTTSRTENNPYGLQLMKITPTQTGTEPTQSQSH